MKREETPNRDSQGHLGPRQGNAVLFIGLDARGERREANRKKAKETEREYDKPV